MDYCCVAWGNTSKQNLDRIYRLQKRGSVKDSLQLPIVTSKSGQRVFAFLASSEWNTLDSDIRNAPSLPSFRNRYLKKAFLKLEDRLIVF